MSTPSRSTRSNNTPTNSDRNTPSKKKNNATVSGGVVSKRKAVPIKSAGKKSKRNKKNKILSDSEETESANEEEEEEVPAAADKPIQPAEPLTVASDQPVQPVTNLSTEIVEQKIEEKEAVKDENDTTETQEYSLPPMVSIVEEIKEETSHNNQPNDGLDFEMLQERVMNELAAEFKQTDTDDTAATKPNETNNVLKHIYIQPIPNATTTSEDVDVCCVTDFLLKGLLGWENCKYWQRNETLYGTNDLLQLPNPQWKANFQFVRSTTLASNIIRLIQYEDKMFDKFKLGAVNEGVSDEKFLLALEPQNMLNLLMIATFIDAQICKWSSNPDEIRCDPNKHTMDQTTATFASMDDLITQCVDCDSWMYAILDCFKYCMLKLNKQFQWYMHATTFPPANTSGGSTNVSAPNPHFMFHTSRSNPHLPNSQQLTLVLKSLHRQFGWVHPLSVFVGRRNDVQPTMPLKRKKTGNCNFEKLDLNQLKRDYPDILLFTMLDKLQCGLLYVEEITRWIEQRVMVAVNQKIHDFEVQPYNIVPYFNLICSPSYQIRSVDVEQWMRESSNSNWSAEDRKDLVSHVYSREIAIRKNSPLCQRLVTWAFIAWMDLHAAFGKSLFESIYNNLANSTGAAAGARYDALLGKNFLPFPQIVLEVKPCTHYMKRFFPISMMNGNGVNFDIVQLADARYQVRLFINVYEDEVPLLDWTAASTSAIRSVFHLDEPRSSSDQPPPYSLLHTLYHHICMAYSLFMARVCNPDYLLSTTLNTVVSRTRGNRDLYGEKTDCVAAVSNNNDSITATLFSKISSLLEREMHGNGSMWLRNSNLSQVGLGGDYVTAITQLCFSQYADSPYPTGLSEQPTSYENNRILVH